MNRRQFTRMVGLLGLSSVSDLKSVSAQQDEPQLETLNFTFLIHPNMVLLDLVGPLTLFNLARGKTHLVWRDRSPVQSDVGIPVVPTQSFADSPREVDVLVVPGGLTGTTALLDDSETLTFLRESASRARFVTSVCTGSLLLGAAGLLQGRRATSHWYTRDLLPLFGAIVSDERVVQDGHIVTGGGVTAGLDFGLTILARLRGEEWARRAQLTLEYDPQPPFTAGIPVKAGQTTTDEVLHRRELPLKAARAASARAALKLPHELLERSR